VPQLPMPDMPPGKLRDLIKELHDLHRLAGWPSLREMAQGQAFSYATVSDLFSKPKKHAPRPRTLLAAVEFLAGHP
jgi:hypothetical protein